MKQNRWSWRKSKRKGIKLYFDKDNLADFRWFPPWQSTLMAENADYMVRILNAAFALGPDAANKIERLVDSGP